MKLSSISDSFLKALDSDYYIPDPGRKKNSCSKAIQSFRGIFCQQKVGTRAGTVFYQTVNLSMEAAGFVEIR